MVTTLRLAANALRTLLRQRSLLVVALLMIVPPAYVFAVSVSPMAVFLDHRTRSGTMTLYNPNPLPEEIEISFAFGYPQSDSTGNVTVPITHADSVPANEPAATAWLRAFPRRLVLQPGQTQTVRILAQPPENLPDGEFWSRVLVTATGGRPPVEQQVQPDVRVAISMKTIIVASLNYRKGKQTTGVKVNASTVQVTPAGVQFTVDLERTGTAAYLGRVRLELQDKDGKVLAKDEDVVSIYHTLRRRFVFNTTDAAALAGARIRYILDNERPEMGQANIITSPAVEGVVPVK